MRCHYVQSQDGRPAVARQADPNDKSAAHSRDGGIVMPTRLQAPPRHPLPTHSRMPAPRCDGEDRSSRARTKPMTPVRSEEHTSELQSLMRTSYAVFCLKKKKQQTAT